MPRKAAVIPERTPQDWLDLIAELERERADRREAAEGIRAERRTLGAALAIGDSDASARHRALGSDLAEQAARLEEIKDAIEGAQEELAKAREAEARAKRHERARKTLALCDEREAFLDDLEGTIDKLAELLVENAVYTERLKGISGGDQAFERHHHSDGSAIWLARLFARVNSHRLNHPGLPSDRPHTTHILSLIPSNPGGAFRRAENWRRSLETVRHNAHVLLES